VTKDVATTGPRRGPGERLKTVHLPGLATSYNGWRNPRRIEHVVMVAPMRLVNRRHNDNGWHAAIWKTRCRSQVKRATTALALWVPRIGTGGPPTTSYTDAGRRIARYHEFDMIGRRPLFYLRRYDSDGSRWPRRRLLRDRAVVRSFTTGRVPFKAPFQRPARTRPSSRGIPSSACHRRRRHQTAARRRCG